MALDNFKKIENNKGYLVNDKDRKIFEREISKGYFGMNIGDVIEFILYDSNDNPLPQESAKGKSVRYIEYNDNTKKEYFGKTQVNTLTKSSNDSEEFFIDTEKLIKEAGYTNGIFKSQVSLLNRRLGSGDNEFDKVWIHEIAPSRTEIRLLPTISESGKPNQDLQHRYDLFVEGKTFLPDVYPFIDAFIQQFDSQKAFEVLLTLKGKVSEGQNYVKLIEQEFKIPNIETYLKKVQDKFIEAATHFKDGREYDITSNRYGLPKGNEVSLDGDINRIYNIMVAIVGQCVEYYLPKRDIQFETSLTLEQQQTLDELQKLQKTETSDGLYKTTEPESISQPTIGCKNPDALNYNPNVDIHDEGLCEFVSDLKICNDPNATNFGQVGVCQYKTPDKPVEEVKPKPKPKPTQEEIDSIIDERIKMAENGNSGIGGGALGGVELDLNDPNEKALFDIVTDTYNEVNKEATRIFFEEQNNVGLSNEGIIGAETPVIYVDANQFDNLSASDRIKLGKASSVVIDGKVKDRQAKQI